MTGSKPPFPTGEQSGMHHLREIMDFQHQQTRDTFAELKERNRVQDMEMEKLAKDLTGRIEAIKSELWAGLKWGAALLSGTVLSVLLKASGLL